MTAVVIVGAPGAGKSSTVEALSDLLAEGGTQHGALELEQLSWGHPWLPFAETIPQLEGVIAAQRMLGRELFLITATTETDEELERLVAALEPSPVLVVALRARPGTVAERILRREPEHWSGRDKLAAHAERLAVNIPSLRRVDVIVDSDDREPMEVARSIHAHLADHGLRRDGRD
jgi:chloramphenicol 3-O-phosphotransferase